MAAIDIASVPDAATLLIDSAPIIRVLENKPALAERFRPVFEAARQRPLHIAVTTVTVAEVLAGPFRAGDEALARRYRAVLDSWRVVDLTSDIAESAARLRVRYNLKLPDAVQIASALAINADALVTHDRDFSRIRSLKILS